MAFYLLQENGDKITLEDGTGFLILEETTAGPTVYYQGDGKGGQRTKRRNRTHELFNAIEATLRATLDGPVVVHPPLSEVTNEVDVTQGYDAALDQLAVLARENEDLSTRVAAIRKAVGDYEARRRALLEADDEEIWLLM